MKITNNFDDREFACRCCGKIKYDINLVIKLECLRSAIGNIPIYINSGYRCPSHNKKVGGVENSMHLQGKAVDIYVKGNMVEFATLADRIFKDGGVGYYLDKNFIHVDTGKKRRWKGK